MKPLVGASGVVRSLRLATVIVFVAGVASAQALSSIPTVPPRPVVISFVGEVNYDSVNRLLRSVTDQVQKGNTDITIMIGSAGGTVEAAYAAFNFLRHLPAPTQITTINIADTDSAAVVLFCAGSKRYSLPGAGMRFLIHGTYQTSNNVPNAMTSQVLEQHLAQVNSANQMVIQAITSATKDHEADIINAVKSQTILTPEQAKDWGLVQEIRDTPLAPGTIILTVDSGLSARPIGSDATAAVSDATASAQ